MKTGYLLVINPEWRPDIIIADLVFENGADSMVYNGYSQGKSRAGDIFRDVPHQFVKIQVPDSFEFVEIVPENY